MSTNRYIDKLKARLAKEADQRMQLQALLDDQVARNRALLAERDAVERALLIAKSDIKVEQRVSANLREHKNDYMDAAEVTRKALLAEIETLKAERDALRKDSERLDWLGGYVVSAESEDTGKIAFSSIRGALRECVDAAIDASLQGEQP